MTTIKLENSEQTVLIDDEDFEQVKQFQWKLSKCNSGKQYACVWKHRKTIYMHRLVLKYKGYLHVDHIDGNGLNNQKSNLRLCSVTQNNANQPARKGTSKYKGAYFCNRRKKWCSVIGFNKQKIWLGTFNSEYEAASAYNIKAKELFGEFAFLNNLSQT